MAGDMQADERESLLALALGVIRHYSSRRAALAPHRVRVLTSPLRRSASIIIPDPVLGM